MASTALGALLADDSLSLWGITFISYGRSFCRCAVTCCMKSEPKLRSSHAPCTFTHISSSFTLLITFRGLWLTSRTINVYVSSSTSHKVLLGSIRIVYTASRIIFRSAVLFCFCFAAPLMGCTSTMRWHETRNFIGSGTGRGAALATTHSGTTHKTKSVIQVSNNKKRRVTSQTHQNYIRTIIKVPLAILWI